jgi:hypothetical protein
MVPAVYIYELFRYSMAQNESMNFEKEGEENGNPSK